MRIRDVETINNFMYVKVTLQCRLGFYYHVVQNYYSYNCPKI